MGGRTEKGAPSLDNSLPLRRGIGDRLYGIAEWFVRYPWAERGSRPVELEPLLPALHAYVRAEPFEAQREMAEWVLTELHEKFDFGASDRFE